VDRNASTPYAGLTVANPRIDRIRSSSISESSMFSLLHPAGLSRKGTAFLHPRRMIPSATV
jgi:hypothetical protein